MPNDLALYVLLVLALGIGFLLGRRERKRAAAPQTGMEAGDYFRGLNHLLNDRHDLAVDTFIESMVINNDTIDTHLVLGALVRSRGEVDKAIRLHQNLLARPALTVSQRANAELELARDYFSAGLLGRAENLLLELVRSSSAYRRDARELLLAIYQRESEWQKAVEVGRELARHDRSRRAELAHFECELAELALRDGEIRKARQHLSRAADFDNTCARVNLVLARVERAVGRHREVIRLLKRARTQDPETVLDSLELYQGACEALNDPAEYLRYLRECLQIAPFVPVVDALGHHLAQTEGGSAASAFVLEHLHRHPSLAGFVALLAHLDQTGETITAEQLALVRQFSLALLDKQSDYRCGGCGFSTRSRMWLCPSCRRWGSIRPMLRDLRQVA